MPESLDKRTIIEPVAETPTVSMDPSFQLSGKINGSGKIDVSNAIDRVPVTAKDPKLALLEKLVEFVSEGNGVVTGASKAKGETIDLTVTLKSDNAEQDIKDMQAIAEQLRKSNIKGKIDVKGGTRDGVSEGAQLKLTTLDRKETEFVLEDAMRVTVGNKGQEMLASAKEKFDAETAKVLKMMQDNLPEISVPSVMQKAMVEAGVAERPSKNPEPDLTYFGGIMEASINNNSGRRASFERAGNSKHGRG